MLQLRDLALFSILFSSDFFQTMAIILTCISTPAGRTWTKVLLIHSAKGHDFYHTHSFWALQPMTWLKTAYSVSNGSPYKMKEALSMLVRVATKRQPRSFLLPPKTATMCTAPHAYPNPPFLLAWTYPPIPTENMWPKLDYSTLIINA